MRLVFMGTPEFAVPSLTALLDAGHEVVGVYTRPDRPAGRGRRLRPSAVADAAVELGLPLFRPPTLRDAAEHAMLAALVPDVVCVAAYGAILPAEVLRIPRLGCVNVHASLLPRWRGAAPIQRAILAADEIVGVSIMLMEEGLDTGPYALQLETPVDERTTAELTAELARLGAQGLLDVLRRVDDGTVVWTPQDESLATYAAKVTSQDVALVPELSAADALRRIRASDTHATSRFSLDSLALTALAAAPEWEAPARGRVHIDANGLVLGFAHGAVRLLTVQREGRPATDAAAFVRGAHIEDGAEWGPLP